MKDSTVTNGPEGTISNKTKASLAFSRCKGIDRLRKDIIEINRQFTDDVCLKIY